ncbi:MAG: HlyD family efflux transporter periplasmic adaptor subunit [candidate division WOR-3 bacterium]
MKKVLIGIIIVIILVVGFFFFRNKFIKKPQQSPINTIEVTKGNIEIKVLATGTIQPFTRVEVTSPTNGRIEQVLVDEGDYVRPGDILAWISSEDRIVLLDAARSKLASAQKQGDSLAIKEALEAQTIAENAYRPVPLTNSIAGQVINRSCEPGQNITTQKALFVIADRLVASVQVDEADIGKISVGQNAIITLDAFPEEKVEGKVAKIDHEGTLKTDVVVYNVLVEPLKVPSYWTSGMTANVTFITTNKQNVLIVPKTAIKEQNGEKFVYVQTSSKPEPRRVITGVTDGKNVEIISGVSEGEKIIADNLEEQRSLRGVPRSQRRMFGGPMFGPGPGRR